MKRLYKKLPNLFCLFLFCFFFFSGTFAQTNVTTQHNNLKRTGWNNTETVLTQNNVSSGSFGKIFTRSVDDQIYAQPLVLSNVSIGGGTHNIVIVATVNNTLYAFDADDSSKATPYWQVNLTYNPGSYRAIKNTDMTGACGGNYHDFSGNMGIVGTPVIDTSTNTIYIVARSVSTSGATFVQYLHALDVTTGAERANSPVYITASVPGIGNGSSGGIVTFDQQKENQRPGLLLYNGNIFISWASHCDWGPYHGWVIAYNATNLTRTYVYNDTPDGDFGGIWMSGQAPAVDDNGNIILTTGNGNTGTGNNPNDTTERGESLIKLSTASGSLKPIDFFTPYDYQHLNDQDLDFGSDGAMLIPNSSLSLSGSKESYLYLIDDNNMGGTTTNNSNVKQLLNINASSTQFFKHIHGSPVYFKNQNANEYIYAWAEGGLLKQFPFNRGTMLFDTLNKVVGNTVLPNGMPGAMLSVSSNGSQSNSGILWASHPINGDANQMTVPGILQAFDANDISHELWNSNWSSKRDAIGNFAKYVAPTIANGKVYMSTFSNVLNVYGINPPPVSACSGTLPPLWQSVDIGWVNIPGDACYNNGTYTVTAAGSDINNNTDAFHYVYQLLSNNSIDITARVVSIQNNSATAKCGVMFRSSLDPGSPNVFMSLTPGAGFEFENRTGQNSSANNFTSTSNKPPYWVKISGNGNKYVGYVSADGLTWTAYDSVTVALGTYLYVGIAYTSNDVNTLGTAVIDNVSLTQSGVLPVNIITFKGSNIENKYTSLNWSTSSEVNIDHFDIESSSNTTDFKLIGSVKASGTSSLQKNYSFNDANPFNGTNFYRLKEVDINGDVKYSSIINVSFNFNKLDIYPNPAHGHIYIRNNTYFTNNNKLIIELINIDGQSVYKQEFTTANGNIITINVPPALATGMYVLNVTNSNNLKQSSKIYITK